MKKLFIGRWRLLWGNCPACNSDAPKQYDCKICDWKLRNTVYEGMSGRTEKEDKKYWWNRFTFYIENNLPFFN